MWCAARYCGQPPAVTNANVVQSTGVTFSATARYQCNPGFAMQGGDTILCTDTGGWTNTPTCRSECMQLRLEHTLGDNLNSFFFVREGKTANL